jgi:two-component system, NtrC family, response regulator
MYQGADMTLLIVEDDFGLQKQYRWSLKTDGRKIVFANNRETALNAFDKHHPQVVLLDLGLPPEPDNASEGLYILQTILERAPKTKVIISTGSEDREHGLRATELGAYDYLQKSAEIKELKFALDRAFKIANLESENEELKKTHSAPHVIGESKSIKRALRTLERIAPAPVSVLLNGESGVGKEVFARTLHEQSGRKGKFVAINCASIPGELLESELFGHERGSFTGADRQKIGKVESANGGTLFLDEIGDMPLTLQAKLLRFLQERVIERVGGQTQISVDVRVVCATHQNLNEMCKNKAFREDLFFRLSELRLSIPPLRERDNDTIILARAFLKQFRKELNYGDITLSDEACRAITSYSWPGNVRELQSKIKTALVLTDGTEISADDLSLPVIDGEQKEDPLKVITHRFDGDEIVITHLSEVRKRAETAAILFALEHFNGNRSAAAEALGMTRPTLYSAMAKYEIEK